MRTILFLIICGCAPKPSLPGQPGQPVQTSDQAAIAEHVHSRINQIRRQQGLEKLDWKKPLGRIATGHSRDMAKRDYFAHNSPEGNDFSIRYESAGFNCRVPIGSHRFLTGGENIHKTWRAEGTQTWSDGRQEEVGIRTVQEVAEQAVQGWMNSPGHRKNILTPEWQSEGIGVWVRADGAVFITQNFC
jgi:uncharacterized protein YkwD